MTVLELKREAGRLEPKALLELHAHVIRLRHQTPEWRKATAKKLRAVKAGKFVTAEQLEAKIRGE